MEPPEYPNPPISLDPIVTCRENQIEADYESQGRMHKVGSVQGFTIHCDESERVGGEHTASTLLGYFTAGIAFDFPLKLPGSGI
jgi:hypothetical protein